MAHLSDLGQWRQQVGCGPKLIIHLGGMLNEFVQAGSAHELCLVEQGAVRRVLCNVLEHIADEVDELGLGLSVQTPLAARKDKARKPGLLPLKSPS